MEKHHFIRYKAENQEVKPGDGSEQSITSRRYALPKQNNLFWCEKDRVNDAKRYGFTDQNNLFCFSADAMLPFMSAILMNTGSKNTNTRGLNTNTRGLYPRVNDITAHRQRGYGSSLTRLRLVVTLFLALLLGVTSAWGQENTAPTPKVANGIYYITHTNGTWYLWPSVVTASYGQPYLTTFNGTVAPETAT